MAWRHASGDLCGSRRPGMVQPRPPNFPSIKEDVRSEVFRLAPRAEDGIKCPRVLDEHYDLADLDGDEASAFARECGSRLHPRLLRPYEDDVGTDVTSTDLPAGARLHELEVTGLGGHSSSSKS